MFSNLIIKKLRHYALAALLLFLCCNLQAQVVLEQQHIVLKKGIALDLKIPRGYHISVSAEGMHRLRFLAKSPDGQLFGTDMYNLGDNNKGRIYLFEDWNDTTKKFQKIRFLPKDCIILIKCFFILIEA